MGLTPRFRTTPDGMHAFPSADALADIELVEESLAMAGIELNVSFIYRLIQSAQANAA